LFPLFSGERGGDLQGNGVAGFAGLQVVGHQPAEFVREFFREPPADRLTLETFPGPLGKDEPAVLVHELRRFLYQPARAGAAGGAVPHELVPLHPVQPAFQVLVNLGEESIRSH
jgi:hypothetical protein